MIAKHQRAGGSDELLNQARRFHIKARKRAIEHEQLRLKHRDARDGEAASLATRQRRRVALRQMRKSRARKNALAARLHLRTLDAALLQADRHLLDHRLAQVRHVRRSVLAHDTDVRPLLVQLVCQLRHPGAGRADNLHAVVRAQRALQQRQIHTTTTTHAIGATIRSAFCTAESGTGRSTVRLPGKS